MTKVIIASKNPVKIQATENAFSQVFPEETFEFLGVSVPSEVSEQPMSNEETLKGSSNRARNAKAEFPDADFWVGLEGGLDEIDNEMEAFAWMSIIRKDGKVGKSRTATFLLPPEVANLVRQGKELGEADDIVFKRNNSKQQNGAVGILTHNIIDRENFYKHAMILALIPFRNPELFL